jgi:hypothetical protein
MKPALTRLQRPNENIRQIADYRADLRCLDRERQPY